MTMFSAAANRRFCGGYGGGGGGGVFGVMSQLECYANSSTTSTTGEACVQEESCHLINNKNNNLVSGSLLMADEEIRNDDGAAAESSSKDIGGDDEEWLQLSIGGHSRQVTDNQDLSRDEKNNKGSNSNLVELELMPSSGSSNVELGATRQLVNFATIGAGTGTTGFITSPFLLQQHHHNINPAPGSSVNYFAPHHNQELINWALIRPIPIGNLTASSSGSGSCFRGTYGGGVDTAVPRPVLDFRVIQPPRRPHSGIWFMLQASQNQEKEPFLPQISKSYLRIKDGKMTIRVVIKYLANKLRLENESEIEIRCKGQRLVPLLTLEEVRDRIWSNPRDFITLLPNSSTTHHIMVLNYARTASNLIAS